MMTEEQTQYLQEHDIPYSPSLFEYCDNNFQKYLAILKLAAFRSFKWEHSEFFESGIGQSFKKIKEYRNND